MDTKQTHPAKLDPASTAQPSSSSSVRLFILLGILAVVVGAYGYDYFVAKPGCEAGDKRIQEFVDARNKMGVKDGAPVTSADIQKELGMQPSYVEKHDDQQYTVEYYCWWGKMPMLSRRRHFISVVYVGNEPRRVSSHHREEPPAEALPIDTSVAQDPKDSAPGSDSTEPPAAADAPAAADVPAKADSATESKPADSGAAKTKEAEEASAKKE